MEFASVSSRLTVAKTPNVYSESTQPFVATTRAPVVVYYTQPSVYTFMQYAELKPETAITLYGYRDGGWMTALTTHGLLLTGLSGGSPKSLP
jgi:hypothetical protein